MRKEFVLNGPEPLAPVPKFSIGVELHQGLIKNRNLPIALIDAVTYEKVSYATILDKTCRLANALQQYGISQNSVIGISSGNNLDFFYPVIAAMYLGCVITTFNPTYTPREILHCANLSQPSIMFCSKITLDVVLDVKQQMHYVKKVMVIDTKEKVKNVETLDDFILNNMDTNFRVSNFRPTDLDPVQQVAFILYSSGTTGLPKGVMLTHKNIGVRHLNARDPRFFKQTDPGTGSTLGLLPFYHAYGLFTVYLSIAYGRQLVVLQKFNESVFLKTIQDFKITHLYLVPPLAIILAKSPLVDKYNLSSIEEIRCGAAPLGRDTEEILKKRLKGVLVRQAYGMTETCLGVLSMPRGEERSGSCGKLFPYVSAKVVDPETGKTLGPGQRGELCFKGDQIMKGYAGDVEATKQTIDQNGWLHSGDVGYYDDDGFFYIEDRLKELIKYNSFQVPPAELEGILLTHPKIADAGVVGFPDELAGELPLAFVVKEPDQSLTEEEVKTFVAKQVSPHKRLRGGVRFVSEIPKNPSGKILRKRLRELVKPQMSKL